LRRRRRVTASSIAAASIAPPAARGTRRAASAIRSSISSNHLGADLEMADEIGIAREEQVVPARVADEHDLGVERHRARLRRGGERRATIAVALLDPDFAVAQRRLERRPEFGVGCERLGAKHEHAAIGAVQAAGAQEGEIGGERALFLAVVDAPEHALAARARIDHHGRPVGVGVVD